MATDQELIDALRRAAEHFLHRQLTDDELQQLIDAFNKSEGTNQQRAIKALGTLTHLTEGQIGQRKAASDNTDRIMNDLRNTIDHWKPGTK